jgi:hypothetical protein
MTDEVVTAAARAAARELAPQYGARVEADVEAALYSAGKSEPPPQFFDPIALGGLIVAIATLAYQVYSDRKKDGHKPSKDTVARAVRVERRKYSDLTAAEEKIIEIVSAEIITSGDYELPGYGTESLRSRPGSVMPSSAVMRPPETVTAMSDTSRPLTVMSIPATPLTSTGGEARQRAGGGDRRPGDLLRPAHDERGAVPRRPAVRPHDGIRVEQFHEPVELARAGRREERVHDGPLLRQAHVGGGRPRLPDLAARPAGQLPGRLA